MSLARFQLPYLTTAQRELITINDKDLVYDTDLESIWVGDGVTAGGNLVSNSTGIASVEDGDEKAIVSMTYNPTTGELTIKYTE